MEKFKDKYDREWAVEVDNSMLADFKAAGLDLSKFPRDETPEAARAFSADLMQLMLDPERLGMILWTLCEERCGILSIDERRFARGFNADALNAACDAVLLVTLAPGSYTAQVSGVGATTGVALVEVYEVP